MGTPLSAHLGTVSLGGAPTVLTQAGTTRSPGTNTFQVTAAANRRLDPATALTVEVDADGAGAGGFTTAAADTYLVNYLTGTVTFAVDPGVSAAVRVSGKFLPVVPLANVRSAATKGTNDWEELGLLGDGHKRRARTLSDLELTLELVDLPTEDQDAGAGTVTLDSYLTSGSPLFLELAAGTRTLRAWVRLADGEEKHTSGSLYVGSYRFQLHAFQGAGQTEYVAWGYGT